MPYYVIAEGLPLAVVREFRLPSLIDDLRPPNAIGLQMAGIGEGTRPDTVYRGPLATRAEAETCAASWATAAAPWFRSPRIDVIKAPTLTIAGRKRDLARALAIENPQERAMALVRHRWRLPSHRSRRVRVWRTKVVGTVDFAAVRSQGRRQYVTESDALRKRSYQDLHAVRRYVNTHDMADPMDVRIVQDQWIGPLTGAIANLATDELDYLDARLGKQRDEDDRDVTWQRWANLQHARRNLEGLRQLCAETPQGDAVHQWPWADDPEPWEPERPSGKQPP